MLNIQGFIQPNKVPPGILPLEIRGNEADPDDLLPHDPSHPGRVYDNAAHVARASTEDELLHDHMKYFGTAAWLRQMPRLAGLRVDGGSDQLPPPPQWIHEDPPADIT